MMAQNCYGIVLRMASSGPNSHPKGDCRCYRIGQDTLNEILPMALGWPIARCDRWIHDGPELLWDLAADGIEMAKLFQMRYCDSIGLGHPRCNRWAREGPELLQDRAADGFEWAQQPSKGGLPMP